MGGPKALSFDSPSAKKETKPVPSALSFPASPVAVKREAVKTTPAPAGIVFGNTPRVAPTVTKVAPGKTMFEVADTRFVSAAIEYARQNFSNVVKTEEERIERQIRQLLPIQYETLTIWGSTTLDEGAQLTTKSAQLIKRFTSLRANELVDKALAAVNPPAGGLFDNLFKKQATTVASYKPNLTVAKDQLTQMMPLCAESIRDSLKLEQRVTLNMVALSSVCSVVTITDVALDSAAQNRRVILQQAAQQYKLLTLQMESVRQQLVEQLANVDQVLTITIPAFEVSNSRN